MPDFAAPVERLIDELKHLPGIGQKTAQRLAFYLLRIPPEDALGLADAIRDAKEKIRTCSVCHNITDSDPCLYCTGANRNKRTICVVEEAHNILAIEKTRMFSGMYHVLGGSLSPLQGRGPDQLNIKSLIERLKGGGVEEIIVATNPTAEGEATAIYMSKLLKPLGVRVTRIGVGIPVGADLEYADEVTMMKAIGVLRSVTAARSPSAIAICPDAVSTSMFWIKVGLTRFSPRSWRMRCCSRNTPSPPAALPKITPMSSMRPFLTRPASANASWAATSPSWA